MAYSTTGIAAPTNGLQSGIGPSLQQSQMSANMTGQPYQSPTYTGVPTTQQAQPLANLNQQPITQQYGLSGAENALQGGLQAGLGALSQGTQQGISSLQSGAAASLNQLKQGSNALGGNFNYSATIGNTGMLGGDFSSGAASVNPLTGQSLFMDASQGVDQFTGAGLQAQNLQSALSGAQGQQAFDSAMLNNPLQNYLNERGQQALANQSAASGGLGSGQFQMELQQLGQAQAGQQLQDQINNLATLSNQGLTAAGQSGQFLSQAGQQQGNLALQNASMSNQVGMANASNALSAAGQQANLNTQNASMLNQVGMANASNALSAAGQQANLYGQGAGILSNLATTGAGMQDQSGINAANLFNQVAGSTAQNRYNTGVNLSNQLGDTTSALAQLANDQGAGNADILAGGGTNIANILQNAGQMDSAQQIQLAQLLSNLSTGNATNLANIEIGSGNSAANTALMQGENFSNLLGNLAEAKGLYDQQNP